MNKLKIAIQGVAGCYHDAAARNYFEGRLADETEIETVPCDTFPALFEALNNDPELIGIMAIENTIAGSILPNFELLRRSHMRVIGEYKMRISHVLCALPGQKVEELHEVNSHPMALLQCEEYLAKHPNLKVVSKLDTADAAREIAENRLTGHAAICSALAAELYGLEILARGIETNKHNFTRFLVIADPLRIPELGCSESDINKASIAFALPHTQGALSKILTILSFYDMNLTKIQSTPIVGREWEYRFYADITFDSLVRFRQAIEAIRPLLIDLRLLGEYENR